MWEIEKPKTKKVETPPEELQGRYLVIGPPGTGKTTFLAAQARAIVSRWASAEDRGVWTTPLMICSLTRAAASEIAGRDLGITNELVGTLHSFCYRAIGKPQMLTADDLADWNRQYGRWDMPPNDYAPPTDEAVWDNSSDTTTGRYRGYALFSELEIHRHKMTPDDELKPEILGLKRAWTEFKQDRGVDFTDMIESARVTATKAPNHPWAILVDESQDLSALEYELVKKWGRQAKAIILVGDPLQSLYTWRGADPRIFYDTEVPESKRRVLSQSYRVPKKVLEASLSWAEQISDYRAIEYKPRQVPIVDEDDIDGDLDVSRASIADCGRLILDIDKLTDTGRSVMFQASCGYMLNNLIDELRDRGIPFANPWRETSPQWNPLGNRRGNTTVSRAARLCSNCPDMEASARAPWTWKDLHLIVEHMKVKDNLVRGVKVKIAEIAADEHDGDDRVYPSELNSVFEPDALGMAVDILSGKVESAKAIDWWSARLGPKHSVASGYAARVISEYGIRGLTSPPRVFVGTIHSFKGAEADVVYVFPDLSKAAMRQWMAGGEKKDEVVRTFYVAMTRSREKLVVCQPASRFCVPLRRHVRSMI